MARPVAKFVRATKLYAPAVVVLQVVERIQRPRKIRRYLQNHTIRKLQIGSQVNVLDGWLNTDLIMTDKSILNPRVTFLDATKSFPFPNALFDYVFSEHMIEHISWAQGLTMLRETFRVLKPGGKVRIATPNLIFLLELYKPNLADVQQDYISHTIKRWQPEAATYGLHEPAFVFNTMLHGYGHQFVYDLKVLKKTLQLAGFVQCCSEKPGQSRDIHLQGVEYHQNTIGEEFNHLETMVIEATKPT